MIIGLASTHYNKYSTSYVRNRELWFFFLCFIFRYFFLALLNFSFIFTSFKRFYINGGANGTDTKYKWFSSSVRMFTFEFFFWFVNFFFFNVLLFDENLKISSIFFSRAKARFEEEASEVQVIPFKFGAISLCSYRAKLI